MGVSTSSSTSTSPQALAFFETLLTVLPARSVSDRTCFRRVAQWLGDAVRAQRLAGDAFGTALLLAREAAAGHSRNPRAVFMSLVRKELGYEPPRPR